MIPKKSIQPMGLVISAIHCMKERKGSSPKEILKYLEGKYDVKGEAIKAEVESGLKRAVSFGLVNQNGGFYRLNKILRSPSKKSQSKPPKLHKVKLRKTNVGLKKLKFGKGAKKNMKTARKKKSRNSKTKRKKKVNKIIKGRNLRRQNNGQRIKFKCQKTKAAKTPKAEKGRQLQTENKPETNTLMTEDIDKM